MPRAAAAPVRRPVMALALSSATGSPVVSSQMRVVPKISGRLFAGFFENQAVSLRPKRPLPERSPERMSMSATPGSKAA